MSKKIAMIGAGSLVFCKTLLSDIMSAPALAASEFALMAPVRTNSGVWRISVNACSLTTGCG